MVRRGGGREVGRRWRVGEEVVEMRWRGDEEKVKGR